MTSSFIFFFFLLITTTFSDLAQDTKSLTSFITQVPHHSRITWNTSQHTCSWIGVTCDDTNSSVVGLRLPAAGLVGPIPEASLGLITSLIVLSLHSNALTKLPVDFHGLTNLRELYLHRNSFTGELDMFWLLTKSHSLVRVDLSQNGFTGELPSDISVLPQLTGLFLQGNKLSGHLSNSIPDTLSDFDVSNNDFNGFIPVCYASRFPLEAFLGNMNLCGFPLRRMCIETVSPSGVYKKTKKNKLVFFEGGIYSFGLEDLLRARSAEEVLGKGSVGTSYKAVLDEEGTTVVVKRLKDVVVSKKEFDGVMEGLGKMKNENVVSIRGYYFSKYEKLLVFDYFPTRSLFSLLHGGSRGLGRTPLDWDDRLRIALSAARGVAYLHVAGKVVHGNIKSSNILLRQDSNKDASVCDFGLNTLFRGSSTPNTRVTGYRAPEVLETRNATFKSDVYSFGVLLLELLTGKAPNQASLGEEGIDLPRWVQSVVREEWAAEVFDVELMRYQNIEEEMVQLLQIAMACVSTVPDQRPAMQEVVRMMEDMNRAETDEGMRQSFDDPSKGSDSHAPPTE